MSELPRPTHNYYDGRRYFEGATLNFGGEGDREPFIDFGGSKDTNDEPPASAEEAEAAGGLGPELQTRILVTGDVYPPPYHESQYTEGTEHFPEEGMRAETTEEVLAAKRAQRKQERAHNIAAAREDISAAYGAGTEAPASEETPAVTSENPAPLLTEVPYLAERFAAIQEGIGQPGHESMPGAASGKDALRRGAASAFAKFEKKRRR